MYRKKKTYTVRMYNTNAFENIYVYQDMIIQMYLENVHVLEILQVFGKNI